MRRGTTKAPPAPVRRRLAVITCHFNFRGYQRPRANLLRFLRMMERAGVPVFGAEVILPRQTSAVGGLPNWKVIIADPAKHILWQKEALLNVALSLVPKQYNAIAWIDADLDFTNPDWVAQSEQALTTSDVIQPFHEAVWTQEDGSVERRTPSCIITGLDRKFHGHPGFAWAVRREVLERAGGLYPYCLLGNADTLMALSFLRTPLWQRCKEALGTNHSEYERWQLSIGQVSTGFVWGQLWHEYHGSRENRRYNERIEIVKSLDCIEAATIDETGLLSWTPQASQDLRYQVEDYFIGRKEDG